jgi:signal peptidase I
MSTRKMVIREVAEWIITFAGAFVIVMLLNTKVFATTQVRQSSMQDTLFEGQHLVIEKLTYDFGDPKRGDIIVFIEDKMPSNYIDEVKIFLKDVSEVFKPIEEKSNVRLVKRVIGLPGDEIDIRDGSVYVNGTKQEEAYTKGVTFTREVQFPVKVPEGKYIVMGDNREVSKDSRSFGVIDRKQVEGKALFRFWPVNKIGAVK